MKGIGRTMKAAKAAAADRPETLIKADEVSDIYFVRGASPSLLARRTWNLLIQAAAGDGWQDKMHSIKKRELCSGWHIGPKEISLVLEELQTTLIKRDVISNNNKAAKLTTALLSSTIAETDNDDSSIIWYRFTPELCSMLRVSEYYVELEKLVYLAFECKYSHSLYERGVRNIRMKRFSEQIKIDDLRSIFGVEKGTLKTWQHLKDRVVTAAVNEVNQLAPFLVQWSPVADKNTKRANPPVVAIQFFYAPKDDAAKNAAKRELSVSKVGRAARRKGVVEQIAQEREEARQMIKEATRGNSRSVLLDDEIPD